MSQLGHNNPPAEPGPYAIYRFAKITSLSELVAAVNHMLRMVPTPNADAVRLKMNQILKGSDDPLTDIMRLIPNLGQRDDGLLLRRTNSVLAVELLLTASPEWWAEATPADREEWQRATMHWIEQTWGKSNVAHMQWHLDETTPHVTGFVVPLDERGALNCRSFIGEKQQVRDQQTSYAAAVEHLGLQRGIEGSKAIHQAVKRHYGAVMSGQQPVHVPEPGHVTLKPEEWAAAATKRMLKQLEPTLEKAKTAAQERTARKGAEATARAQGSVLEAIKAERQALAAQMREMDLGAVCDALALAWDEKDKVWRGETVKIGLGDGVKAGKWFDYHSDKGRGGAIDLTQHVMGCDFNTALAFLGDRFGPGAAAADHAATVHRDTSRAEATVAKEKIEPFTPPRPVPENWAKVREHLSIARKLPLIYIDRLHEKGELYADDMKNAVFICKDANGVVTGAEKKGTVKNRDGKHWSGLAAGSQKDLGGFRIGSILKAKTIYLVESAIDAISLLKLRMDAGEREFSVISTAGYTPEPRSWFRDVSRKVRRICAFDADKAGDDSANKLRRHKFERLRPTRGKDWNDELRAIILEKQDSDTSQDNTNTNTNTQYEGPETPSL